MPLNLRDGIRLFKVWGITVFLHPAWFLVAIYGYQVRMGAYQSKIWPAAEYLALFGLVLLHEFGHALACRSVGGKAERIILWPLGGIAYVSPPMRPGAMLWSILAGPLVNVVLLGVFWPLLRIHVAGNVDAETFLRSVAVINIALLAFNLLPIYPLDGGKIVWSLLWFLMGCAKALIVAAGIGILGAIGLGILALMYHALWLGAVVVYAIYRAVTGIQQGVVLWRRESAPRRAGMACPACHQSPPMGPFWFCNGCKQKFDAMEYPGRCPNCGVTFNGVTCFECGKPSALSAWMPAATMGLTAHQL